MADQTEGKVTQAATAPASPTAAEAKAAAAATKKAAENINRLSGGPRNQAVKAFLMARSHAAFGQVQHKFGSIDKSKFQRRCGRLLHFVIPRQDVVTDWKKFPSGRFQYVVFQDFKIPQ